MTKRRTELKAMAVKEGRGNGIEPDGMTIDGIIPVEGMSIEEAQMVLQAKRDERIANCNQEIDAAIRPILEKYNCMLDVIVTIQRSRVSTEIVIIPKD